MLLGDLQHRWGFDGHPHLLALGAPLPFLFGPLVYLYAVALTRPVLRFDPRWFAHALPFAADVLFMAQVFYLKGGAEKLALARATNAGNMPISLNVVTTLEVAQALVYLFLTWQGLERYGKKMHGYFSDLARIDLRWLKAFVLAHVGVWSFVLLATVLHWTGHTWHGLGSAVQLGASFTIFLTGYISLWQPELAQKASAATAAEEDTPKEPDPPEPAPRSAARTRSEEQVAPRFEPSSRATFPVKANRPRARGTPRIQSAGPALDTKPSPTIFRVRGGAAW